MYNPNLHFHFTGIGGSGMSGLAEILLSLGFQVSGTDLKISPVCQRLQELGAQIVQGHAADHIPATASLLVYSSAVSRENPELLEAERRGIPIIRRAEVLAELMRLKYGVGVAGSHGKTTTTSLIATVMEQGGLDPTVVIGGRVKSIGSGGKLGKGAYLVAESDESDRSFLLLRPTIAVVTNIDREHLDAYDSFQDLVDSFEKFVSAVPFYGLAVLCADDPLVSKLAASYRGRKVTYGFAADADLRAVNVQVNREGTSCDLIIHGESVPDFRIPIPAKHILQNALAAVAVGLEFGVSQESIRLALQSFSGVERRLEVLSGSSDSVAVISDYGHHPTEIQATITAVRDGWRAESGQLHVVFQPHRYTRTRDCFEQFAGSFEGCDSLFVLDIHSAGEEPLEGITADALTAAIEQPPQKQRLSLAEIDTQLDSVVKPGDVVLFLGAGSIGVAAHQFAEHLTGEQAPLNRKQDSQVAV